MKNEDWKDWAKYVLEEIKSLHEEQKTMNGVLIENTQSLKEHMRRTENIEEVQVAITNTLQTSLTRLDDRLRLIEQQKMEKDVITKYRNQKLVKWGKVVGIVATVIGLLTTLSHFMSTGFFAGIIK